MKKRRWFLMLSLMLVFVLVGCSVNDNPGGLTPEDIPKDTEKDDDKDTNPDPDMMILAVDGYDIFSEKYPNVEIEEFKFDEDDGKRYYKIEGYFENKEYEMKIDNENGNIFKDEIEDDDNDDSFINISRDNVTKAAGIVEMALEEAGADAVLDEWTLKTEDNKLVVEVEIDRKQGHDSEITYDLMSGEIIEIDD